MFKRKQVKDSVGTGGCSFPYPIYCDKYIDGIMFLTRQPLEDDLIREIVNAEARKMDREIMRGIVT